MAIRALRARLDGGMITRWMKVIGPEGYTFTVLINCSSRIEEVREPRDVFQRESVVTETVGWRNRGY